jgi:uracil phosphoribosyltransferase
MRHNEDEYCGVSILRAGDSMVEPIMQLIPGIAIGKILIQRDEKTAEPIFFYQKQVQDLKDKKRVFLLDPMLATGGSASMAIKQIRKSGVPCENITFINLVACDEGI